MVPWGVRGLYEAPAIEHEACPSTMGGESPRTIKHPAVIGLDGLRAPVTVVGEFLRFFALRIAFRCVRIVHGLNEVLTVERKERPPAMGGESFAIKQIAPRGLSCLRTPFAVAREMLRNILLVF